MKRLIYLPLLLLLAVISCHNTQLADVNNQTSTTKTTSNSGDTTNSLKAVMDKFTGVKDIYVDGDYLVIETADIPDHKSCYFPMSDSMYEAYNGNNPYFRKNPNHIGEQDLIFRIPLHPKPAANKQPTPMGPIGISVNGVVFFNQYAAGRSKLDIEINSFDQGDGHPQASNMYHYHLEPTLLTKRLGKDAFLGILLDGYPVYGPEENGKTITDNDLDEYHGHFGKTKEFPNGIYHYHITADDPYINGNGFYGTPGTVSQ